MSMVQDAPIYRLSTVLERTGLKADTVRAWERRYGLPTPQRTQGDHRLYSERDIATLKWLKARTDEGICISQAVALWRKLSEHGRDPLSVWPSSEAAQTVPSSALDHLRAAWLNACMAFDERAAEQMLNQAFALYDIESVCLQVLCQGLQEIGELWYRNQATVQQEHFAVELIVRRLHTLVQATPPATRKEILLIATPSTEQHSVPTLLLTLLLRRRGLQVLYLGSDVPAERLGAILEDMQVTALILAAQLLSSAAVLQETARMLLGSGIPVGYGGRIFNTVPEIRHRIPAHFLGETIEEALTSTEILLRRDLPQPEVLPPDTSLISVRNALLQARDAIAFDVMQRMVQLGASAADIDTGLRFTCQQLLAALALGDLNFMRDELAWVKDLLQHRQVEASLLTTFWLTYRDAVVRHMDGQGRIIADWLEANALSD
ncbi:MAG: MerR family transcriptional regulator [Anaerolineae bacterium]|nr:MerR family transcriptional regulator [Anaerolineae bacterium]MDW8098436.1 MerR family transcriptional regulator [Anaerolineae bacterium]